MQAPRATEPADAAPADLAWRGIEHCRRGDWQEGLCWLSLAAAAKPGQDELQEELPGLFYAFLGYGIARYQRQGKQGLKLCRRAVELELYQPESYYFLARTHLLLKDRRAAFDDVERGLEVDSAHAALTALRLEIGERRAPVVGFLPRRHVLNRWLGLLRHRLVARRWRGA